MSDSSNLSGLISSSSTSNDITPVVNEESESTISGLQQQQNFKIKSHSRYFSPQSNITTKKFNYLDNPFYYMDKDFDSNHHHHHQQENRDHEGFRNGHSHTNSTSSDGNNNINKKRKRIGKWNWRFKRIDLKKSFRFIIAIVSILVIFVLAIIFAIMSSFIINNPIRNGHKIEKLTNINYAQLKSIRTNLIDPDTPIEFYNLNKTNHQEGDWTLVFSDEFELDGRTFHEGDDQFFTAVELYYAATHDLEYYLPQMITTNNSNLEILFDKFNYSGLNYVSGMLQTWNKLCFNKHVKIEIKAKLPYEIKNGLWPAIWSLGNLARPGFLATTDGIWPYTYNECDFGILPNQSTLNEEMSYLPGQRLSKCVCTGEDHPNHGIGRGAPEIDIIEGLFQYDKFWGVQTLQVAPFDEWWRPDYDYVDIINDNITIIREDIGTVYQESISLGTLIDNEFPFQKFTMEYKSDSQNNINSYLKFSIDDITTSVINGSALHPNEFIGWREITKEPMSIILNMGLSYMWNPRVNIDELKLPAKFLIDYIRIYQPNNIIEMTCDPIDYPTDDYIQSHSIAYENPNLTSWFQAGFEFPKNSLSHQCKVPPPIVT
ncbi:beta-glucan synthase, putative [Candida dubliniensis CD36]|uniref:Beta-glucan synthesis-associated protein, putative n=1 Tax=Candida dubliniensis (strain CD36 / ATCC MYA-646 / CBS 7987 / NCPF 3949 / NRRL Y-17841) TaxID=573826 RepID=B9WGZ1_CANDC|nr:beta-glucan synthase, putative [Candida dubliniensis CD36]CAX41430.1 beta-glucan synthase, putative [Candida dubliniensis CD36]